MPFPRDAGGGGDQGGIRKPFLPIPESLLKRFKNCPLILRISLRLNSERCPASSGPLSASSGFAVLSFDRNTQHGRPGSHDFRSHPVTAGQIPKVAGTAELRRTAGDVDSGCLTPFNSPNRTRVIIAPETRGAPASNRTTIAVRRRSHPSMGNTCPTSHCSAVW